jgi:hypothetical protein
MFLSLEIDQRKTKKRNKIEQTKEKEMKWNEIRKKMSVIFQQKVVC